MLERASSCLESGGRQLFRAPKPCLRSRRKLHSTFWHHGASDLSLPLWWAINPTYNGGSEQSTTSGNDAAPLDFLYPEKTLALLRKLSIRSDTASAARRQRIPPSTTRNYATGRARRLQLGASMDELEAREEAVDAAEVKEAKREMHERLMGSSAKESLEELLRREEPGKQELAWQLYYALPAGAHSDLLLPLLDYLTADNEPAVPTRIIKLFDQLPQKARTAAAYRAVIVAYVALREVAPAINLHRTAAESGFFTNDGDVPNIGTDVLLRRLVQDEQWDLALNVYTSYVQEHRFSINRQRTIYRIRWGQATLPEIWTEAAQLPEIKEHLQALFVYIRQNKEELISTPRRKQILYTFVQSFLPHIMDRILLVRKPNEDNIWDWFIKLFEDLHEMEIPTDASYNYAITKMLNIDRYRAYTNQRKLHLELYRRYRQWYLYNRVDDPPEWRTMPPQVPMLSLVLNGHGSHGSLHRVNDLVNDIHTFYPDKPLPPNVLRSLMQIYAEHGDVKRVDEYFDQYYSSTGKMSHKEANNLIYVQARRADIPGALAAMHRIREDLGLTPDVQMWNVLLLTYVRADDLDGALETFNHALDAGIEPTILTFGPLLDMCANRGDIEAFEALYSRAKQMGIALDTDVRARSGYVQAFLNADDPDGAEEIAQGMLNQWKAGLLTGHPLTHTWNIMIQHYALKGDVANSRRLYRQMVDNKIPLDNITFASLMRSLVEIKQTNAAYKILRETLPAHKMRVEAIHYAIVMTGFLKEAQYDLALEAYERMAERKVSQTISSKQAAINTVGMSELVRLLKAKNRNPRQQLQHVEHLLREMLTSGDVGQDVAHRQPSHNRYIDAQTQAVVPASYYGLLITLYNTRGAYKICKELFAKAEASMEPSDFDAPTTFLTAIMEAHYKAQEWDEVQKCWHLIRESSSKLIKTFQQVMNPTPEPDDNPSLTDGTVIQRFEESRIALNRRQVIVKATRIYIRSLINRNPKKYSQRQLLEQAQLTIRDLLVNGFVLDNFTWNEFIVALAQNNQLVAAFSIAEIYLMPRFPGWRHLMPFYIRNDRKGYQWMELRHYDIKRNSVLPRYKTLVVLAKAMAIVKEDERSGLGYVEREQKWARELLEENAPSVCRAVETMPRTSDAMQERYFGAERRMGY